MKKHVLTDLSNEAWYVIIAVDDGDVVAFTEGQLILNIFHEETGVPMTKKQQIKPETLDQLEEFGLIEHVPGEHLDTIRLSEAGKYWYGRKCKTDSAEFKRRSKNMPHEFDNRSICPDSITDRDLIEKTEVRFSFYDGQNGDVEGIYKLCSVKWLSSTVYRKTVILKESLQSTEKRNKGGVR